MKHALERIGSYISGPGGAENPVRIPKNQILFELITEGAVYAPDDGTLQGIGAVFAHRPGQETVSRTEGDGHYACMTASFRVDRIPSKVTWPRHFLWDDIAGVLRFAEEMLYAFHHTALDHGVLGDLIWSQFRFRLNHFGRKSARREIPPRIAAVMASIERQYGEPVSIDALAKQVDLSPSHLHAQFREHVGITPHQHLILQRMRAARHKLATSNDPVKAVAAAAGYANTENFCRAFKKHSGVTAASYRRKYMTY